MRFVEVRIAEIVEERSAGECHRVIIEDIEGTFRIPIIISSYDAQPLIKLLEGRNGQRPRTHDLMLNFVKMAGYLVRKVEITGVERGVFSAVITFGNGNADSLRLDSRPSDAFAIALRSGCGIFVSEEIAREIGEPVVCEDEYTLYPDTIAGMEQRLKMLIDKELYEEAAKLRDIINSLKGSSDDPVS